REKVACEAGRMRGLCRPARPLRLRLHLASPPSPPRRRPPSPPGGGGAGRHEAQPPHTRGVGQEGRSPPPRPAGGGAGPRRAGDGRALFAGSGGSPPSPIYARLSEADLDWASVAATLVDERYVPEASPDSNAALLKRTLLTGPAAAARFIPLYSPAVTVDRAA